MKNSHKGFLKVKTKKLANCKLGNNGALQQMTIRNKWGVIAVERPERADSKNKFGGQSSGGKVKLITRGYKAKPPDPVPSLNDKFYS